MPAAGMKSYFKSFDRRIRAGMNRNVGVAAVHYRESIQAGIAIQGSPGNHSAPGDKPFRQEGDLIKSYSEWNNGEMRWRVGSDLEYARYLEQGRTGMLPRPHIERTLLEEEFEIGQRMCKPI